MDRAIRQTKQTDDGTIFLRLSTTDFQEDKMSHPDYYYSGAQLARGIAAIREGDPFLIAVVVAAK